MKLISLLTISGSPIENSSTDILLQWMSEGFTNSPAGRTEVVVTKLKLNELKAIPCQACGQAPTPAYCFYDDEMTALYEQLIKCDCLLLGSPIYFDSVSAQTKLMIDRCNCLRPPNFDSKPGEPDFVQLIKKKRPGAMVLVGGENGYFEGARRTIAGWFKWIEIANGGMISYASKDFNRAGEVADNKDARQEAVELGQMLASEVNRGG